MTGRSLHAELEASASEVRGGGNAKTERGAIEAPEEGQTDGYQRQALKCTLQLMQRNPAAARPEIVEMAKRA